MMEERGVVTFDLPYVKRRWRDGGYPKIISGDPLKECTSLRPGCLALNLDTHDVWTLHDYVYKFYGATLNISRHHDFWIIMFCSSKVMLAFHRWLTNNKDVFLSHFDATEKQIKKHEIVSLEKDSESLVVIFANKMLLGNITDMKRTLNSDKHFFFRTIADIASSTCYFYNASPCAIVDTCPNISIVFQRNRGNIIIFFRVLYKLCETWFRMVIPFSTLLGRLFVREERRDDEDGLLDICILIPFASEPLIYRQTYLDEEDFKNLSSPTGSMYQEWVRDYNPHASVQYMASSSDDKYTHPLHALQYCSCIALCRGGVSTIVVSRLKAFLYHASLMDDKCCVTVDILCPYSDDRKTFTNRFMTKLRQRRSFQVVLMVMSLISYGVISDVFHVATDNRCVSLVNPEMGSDTIILMVLTAVFSEHQTHGWTGNFPRRYHECFRRTISRITNADCTSNLMEPKFEFFFTITPFMIYLTAESSTIDNRILRKYSSNNVRFFRARFSEKSSTQSTTAEDTAIMVRRIEAIFTHGIHFLDLNLQFLGYSQSQLKSLGCWFVWINKKQSISPTSMLEYLGDFNSMETTGRMAARVGQYFSSSLSFLQVNEEDCVVIDDTISPHQPDDETKGYYCFTDGVGFADVELFEAVREKQNLPSLPSAIQVRYKGFKGMLSVLPLSMRSTLSNPWLRNALKSKIVFRRSMEKFYSPHGTLDIIASSSVHTGSLNRQLLLALDSLGLATNVVLAILQERVVRLTNVHNDPTMISEFLQSSSYNNTITKLICYLLNNNICVQEPFIQNSLKTLVTHEIRLMIHNLQVSLPCCCSVFGISDETQTLKYDNGDGIPQVFLRLRGALFGADSTRKTQEEKAHTIVGPFLVNKFPVLYPGDCQLCFGVDDPRLYFYENVLVFPQRVPSPTEAHEVHPNHPTRVSPFDPTYAHWPDIANNNGFRDIPSMLSGSDLDGDHYFVCWDPRIVHHLTQIHRKQYSIKPAGFYLSMFDEKISSADSTQGILQRLQNHFKSSARDRSLKIIATCHLRKCHDPEVYATGKALHPCAVELANLHSKAVDCLKTESPVHMRGALWNRFIPHFHKPLQVSSQTRETHHSKSLLGRVYDRAVEYKELCSLDHCFREAEASLLRYEPAHEAPSSDLTPDTVVVKGYYVIHVQWKSDFTKVLSSRNHLTIAMLIYDTMPDKDIVPLRCVYGHSSRATYFNVHVENKENIPLYVTFELQMKVMPVFYGGTNAPYLTNILMLSNGQAQRLDSTQLLLFMSLRTYICLFLYNSPFSYSPSLLEWIRSRLSFLTSTDESGIVTVVHSFNKLPDALRINQLYDDPSVTDKKTFHFSITVDGAHSWIEMLMHKISGTSSISIGHSNNRLPGDMGMAVLCEKSSSIVTTHPLELDDLNLLNMYTTDMDVHCTSLHGPATTLSCLKGLMDKIADTPGEPISAVPLSPALTTTTQLTIKLCFPSFIERRRFVRHIMLNHDTPMWHFSLSHSDDSLDNYDLPQLGNTNESEHSESHITKNEPELYNSLVKSFDRHTRAIKSLRRVLCFFPLTLSFFRRCFHTVFPNPVGPFSSISQNLLLHAIRVYIEQFVQKNICSSQHPGLTHHDDLISTVLFTYSARDHVWSTYNQRFSRTVPHIVFSSCIVITPSFEATRTLVFNSFRSSPCTVFFDRFIPYDSRETSSIGDTPSGDAHDGVHTFLFFTPLFNDTLYNRLCLKLQNTDTDPLYSRYHLQKNYDTDEVDDAEDAGDDDDDAEDAGDDDDAEDAGDDDDDAEDAGDDAADDTGKVSLCRDNHKKKRPLNVLLRHLSNLDPDVLHKFPVLNTQVIDKDLIHHRFIEHIPLVELHLNNFLQQRDILLHQFSLSDETQLIAGWVLGDRLLREEAFSERITSCMNRLESYFKNIFARLFLRKTNDERRAFASAAYVLNHQRAYVWNSLRASDRTESLTDSAVDNVYTYATVFNDNTQHTFSHSFCWIFFKYHLISLKQRGLV